MAQNKRSAQRGRVMGTTSPLSEAQRYELAEAIVNHLKPWKNNKTRATVMAAVNQSLDVLPEMAALQTKLDDPRPIRKHAKKLDKALSNVQRLLASSPDPLAFLLFDPRPALMQVPDNEYSDRFRPAIRARADELRAELERLRKVCAWDFRLHANYDNAKHLSAEFSWVLMIKYSDKKITGTEGQAFRIISSLIYEVVSGQKDADLKRSCDEALQYMNPNLYQTTD